MNLNVGDKIRCLRHERILRRKSLRQSLGYLVNLYHVGRMVSAILI